MVTLIRVNMPSLPVWGIPPTLSMQILCFAVLSPREREWPLHLSSYPRQKPDSFKCLNTGRFISLISALTLASLACWWGWARSKFLLSILSISSFPIASFPEFPHPCVYMLAYSSFLLCSWTESIMVVWTASLSLLRLCPILWNTNSPGICQGWAVGRGEASKMAKEAAAP